MVINKCEKNELHFAAYILCFLMITAACIKIRILLPWSLDTFLLGTIFMMVGYRLKKKEYFSRQFKVSDAISVCIMFWFLWILVMYNGCGNMSVREFGPHHYISVIVYAGAGCIGSVLCLWFSKLIEKSFFGTVLSIIGRHSFDMIAMQFVIFVFIDYVTMNVFRFDIALNVDRYKLYQNLKIVLAILVCLGARKGISFIKNRFANMKLVRVN